MGKPNLASIAKSVRTAMKKHSPEILTGIGIAGMITTTIMALLYSVCTRRYGICTLPYRRKFYQYAS